MKRFAFGLFFAITATIAVASPQKISFNISKDDKLNALFVNPQAGKPTIIMLHGLASSKEEWNPLIAALEKKGYGVLAYDMQPPSTPWPYLVNDIGAAVQFLESQKINRKTVVLAGASLGANVCLKYASLTSIVKAVVLLSPGENYQGCTTLDAIKGVKAPILIVASSADPYAFQSSKKLAALSKLVTFWESTKPGHGVQMFDQALLDRIIGWVSKSAN